MRRVIEHGRHAVTSLVTGLASIVIWSVQTGRIGDIGLNTDDCHLRKRPKALNNLTHS